MKTNITLFFILCFFKFNAYSQTNINELIIKNNELPIDWIKTIESKSIWTHIKTYNISKKNKIENIINFDKIENLRRWTFLEDSLLNSPVHFAIPDNKFTEYRIKFYEEEKKLLIESIYIEDNKTYKKNEIYHVLNLTDKFLILEKIEGSFCFDYKTGKKLTKKECDKKGIDETIIILPKLFGGTKNSKNKKTKNILVFKCNQ